jgi:hypothetical protein
MTEELKPIEVKTEGTTRILKIGDLTINVDQAAPAKKLESPPGILFDFDRLVVRLIIFFDQVNNVPLRDALLMFRSQLATQPELVNEFQKICGSCVLYDDVNWVRIEKNKWDDYIKELQRAEHHVDPDTVELYVGDDFE